MIRYGREYFYDAVAHTGCYPFDEALEVTSQISAGLTRTLVKLCARLPYEEAVEVYGELTGVTVSVSTAWQRTQAIGQRARPALDSLPSMKPTHPNATGIGISMDGCMANVREEGWKEIKAGVTFEVSVHPDRPRINQQKEAIPNVYAHQQSYVLHLGGPEGFGVKLATEALARHWASADQSVVIGDGAVWIWKLAARDYPSSAHVVDWYHAKHHLCCAAELLFPNAPDQAEIWLQKHADLLYAGKANEIAQHLYLAAALAKPDLKDDLETEAGYFADNHERMQYRDFQLAGLPIGSGTVESAAKQTKHRVSAAGMRWSREGLENLLPLRAALMSGSFDAFWQQIAPL